MQKKLLIVAVLIWPIFSFGQQILLGDNELNVFHGTHGSFYSSGLYDAGYSIGVYSPLNGSISAFTEIKPSIASTDAYQLLANIPVMVGVNYGKIGFDPELPSKARFGAYLAFGIAPYFSIGSDVGGTSYQFCTDAGIRLRMRSRDMTVSFLTYANFGQGLRVTYTLPPFE